MCQDIAYSLNEGAGIDAIIIDISKAFYLVPYNRLLTKLTALGMVSTVVVWSREFLVVRTQRLRVGGQLSEEVISGVPQGGVLGPHLFLVCVNDIWRNIDLSIRLFAEDCIIYRKITNNSDNRK